ncbi:hypothetical protein BCV69DRAFT_76674 [Microstroma glucosiphilum]|uniref:Uncharacterized protein n=1 Tax=Pseudomicrostroma glucosiphilum TaxID=1684307 RepID=A0A316U270_9BASI|nr:hypothetical protein BCV69DRAFT_76674 [Pseudomicrostroma glucosiphilum]PWN18523.1 hypothetical protein BCV69DRAFT_76674 [Pseudomicrostroma glucosiphilum]
MPQPATAGIVLGGIFGGAAVLYFTYRLHRRWRRRRGRGPKHPESELPPIRPANVPNPWDAPNISSQFREGGQIYGRHIPRSYSMPTSPIWDSETASPFPFDFKRTPSPGLLTPAVGSSSASGSPSPGHTWGGTASGSNSFLQPLPPAAGSSSPTADGLEPLLSDRPGTRLSVISSSSSTMALKRSYASSVHSSHLTHSSSTPIYGLGMGHLQGQPAKRSSYLPHSPLNRDKIQIVPPQPLGIGLGGLATAVDQRTLAFSPASGIGDGTSELFGQDVLWPSSDPAEGSERPQRPARVHNSTSRSSIGHDERMRYLQEGPARQASPAEFGSSKRPTLDPAARITSSPRQSESRSRSPAHLTSSTSAGQGTPDTLHPSHTPPPSKSRTNSSTGRQILAAPPTLPHIPASQDSPSSALPQYPSLSREATPRADTESRQQQQPTVAMPSPVRPLARILSASGSHHSSAETYARGGTSEREEIASAGSPGPAPEGLLSESPKGIADSSQRLSVSESAPIPQNGEFAAAPVSLATQPQTSTGAASPISPPLAINFAWNPANTSSLSTKGPSQGTRNISPARTAGTAAAGGSDQQPQPQPGREDDVDPANSSSSRVTSSASTGTAGTTSGSASASGSGSGSTTTDTAGSSTENLGALLLVEGVHNNEDGSKGLILANGNLETHGAGQDGITT